MSKVKIPNAFWGLSSLLRSLARAGWGELGAREFQGVRAVLLGLKDILPDKSARGKCTAFQISLAAGRCERTVRTALARMEDIGIICWYRGGIINGIPQPSFIEISKRALVALIMEARKIAREKIQTHLQATSARLAGLKNGVSIKNKRYSRRSDHAEIITSLSTLTGEYTPRSESEGVYSIVDDPYITKIKNKIRVERLEQAEREKEDKAIEAVKDYDLQAKKYMAQGLTMSQAYIKALKERHLKYA